MRCPIRLKPQNLGARSKQVQFALVDASESSNITHKDAVPNSNCRIRRFAYSAIIVFATSGCYGGVGVEEPRHEQRNQVRHEERHDQPANEHREERHDEARHD